MNFEEQIKSNCGSLPYDRIKISQFSQLELATITQAVLFVFATWSGAAVVSFRLLCEALAKSPVTKFPIIVVNADGFDFDAFKKAFGELPQGKGEAFWIKRGQVVFRDHGYTNETSETLQERIKSLNSPESNAENVRRLFAVVLAFAFAAQFLAAEGEGAFANYMRQAQTLDVSTAPNERYFIPGRATGHSQSNSP